MKKYKHKVRRMVGLIFFFNSIIVRFNNVLMDKNLPSNVAHESREE